MAELSGDRREKTEQGCPGARAAALEAGREDEHLGERPGSGPGKSFQFFPTKARTDMGGVGRGNVTLKKTTDQVHYCFPHVRNY